MMQKETVLDADAIPQVAMEAMNEVHREELDIVNQLNRAIIADDGDKITPLCQEWLLHTKAHFDKENIMMDQYNFSAYHCHYQEHVEALEGLTNIITAWQESRDKEALTTYVRDIWPAWYINHIATMDTMTSAFIKQCIGRTRGG